jgi:hypothetical protein
MATGEAPAPGSGVARLVELSSEKLPTDYERDPSGEQDYEPGSVDSQLVLPLGPLSEPPRARATLLALFGILIKRYGPLACV